VLQLASTSPCRSSACTATGGTRRKEESRGTTNRARCVPTSRLRARVRVQLPVVFNTVVHNTIIDNSVRTVDNSVRTVDNSVRTVDNSVRTVTILTQQTIERYDRSFDAFKERLLAEVNKNSERWRAGDIRDQLRQLTLAASSSPVSDDRSIARSRLGSNPIVLSSRLILTCQRPPALRSATTPRLELTKFKTRPLRR
jgi:hypothetical protein